MKCPQPTQFRQHTSTDPVQSWRTVDQPCRNHGDFRTPLFQDRRSTCFANRRWGNFKPHERALRNLQTHSKPPIKRLSPSVQTHHRCWAASATRFFQQATFCSSSVLPLVIEKGTPAPPPT